MIQYRVALYHLGTLVAVVGLTELTAIPWSLVYGDDDWRALLLSVGIAAVAGGLMRWAGDGANQEIRRREGLLIVACGWLLAAAVGALPFWLYGALPSYVDAYFEAMSGFTTTGASVVSDLEQWPHGLLFWRSFTHWLGGMGIIVLFIAVLPLLGVGGRQLFKGEVPGPVKEGLLPRIQQTARMLWLIYLGLSVLETALLWMLGMSLFEALCHTFGTMATGGFSTRLASVAAYDSVAIEVVITLFMVLAGANFALHYQLLMGRARDVWKDIELRFYLGLIVAGTVTLTLVLALTRSADGWLTSLRLGSFQVVSVMTTTGFATAEFGGWPASAQIVLLLFMFVGGCAGSTGGSMKVVRVVILIKVLLRGLRQTLDPYEVRVIRLGRRVLKEDVVAAVVGFFFAFMALWAAAAVVLTFAGLDLVTALSASAATLGNIGPGLGRIAPPYDYAFMPTGVKALLSLMMMMGRLEVFSVLVLFLPRFWRP